ncbi:hypothetical protein JCM18899A_41560 [Nocardioides sp. AN3]
MSEPEPLSDDQIVGSLLQCGLDVAYQPIVAVDTGVVIGWEALLRGELPEHGAVSPEDVVGSASRTGALDRVMRQVTEQALTTATVASLRLGRRMTVSINVEPHQLRPDSAFLRWLVDRSASSAAQLLLEITERSDDPTWAAAQDEALAQLRGAGLPLAIDDLGAGASRMRLLAQQEWTWVKLDRGFLAMGDRGRILLRHTVTMLHELGTTVLLEGIETAEQLDVAGALEVDLAQGNFLGVPIPAQELLDGLRVKKIT